MEPIIDPKAPAGELTMPTREETRKRDLEWLNQEIVDSIPQPVSPTSPSPPPVQTSQQVTSNMDMVERVMINHPGLTREMAQKFLDAAGY